MPVFKLIKYANIWWYYYRRPFYIYYGICPCSNFPLIHLILHPKIYPAPFLLYYPQNKTLFKTGEILPKAYLEWYYGIIIRRRSYTTRICPC